MKRKKNEARTESLIKWHKDTFFLNHTNTRNILINIVAIHKWLIHSKLKSTILADKFQVSKHLIYCVAAILCDQYFSLYQSHFPGLWICLMDDFQQRLQLSCKISTVWKKESQSAQPHFKHSKIRSNYVSCNCNGKKVAENISIPLREEVTQTMALSSWLKNPLS